MTERLTGSIRALGRAGDPFALYRAMYGASVKAQSVDLRLVDVEPDDPLLPMMSNIPLYLPIAGVSVALNLPVEAPWVRCLVGWENGKPDRPFCLLCSVPPEQVKWISLGVRPAVGRINLGSAQPGDLLPVLDGVLTGRSIDPFTGLTHAMLGNASAFVMAKK